MKKKKIVIWSILFVLILTVGGTLFFNKRAEDRKELEKIQRDLANHLYNNYRLYTNNEEKDEQLVKEFDEGRGDLTTEEFIEKSFLVRDYEDIETVEFTGFSKSPMGGLEVSFLVNEVFPDTTHLIHKSYETNEWIYTFNLGNTRNAYVLDKRETPVGGTLPKSSIIYHEGGIE